MDGSYVFPPKLKDEPAFAALPPLPLGTDLSSPPPEHQSQLKSKRSLILKATEDKDLKALRRLSAGPGGFLTDDLRRVAWPVLLGSQKPEKDVVESEVTEDGDAEDDGELVGQKEELEGPPPHKDEAQVRLDVIRSFVNYPLDVTLEEKEALRVKLEDVIVTVLRRYPALSYFQGYHDIISVLLLTLDDQELSIAAAERMSLHRIRDSLGPGLEPVLGYLKLVHRILEQEDPDLSYIVSIAAALPYFTLSWILTLLSHDLTSLRVTARLFDFLLAHNPAMVSYIGVAIILLKKEELASLDESSVDDPAMLHHTLSQLPKLFEPRSDESSDSGDSDDDEDLASTVEGSRDSNFSRSPTLSSSYLTESLVRFGSSSDSLDALDDAMLSDPDITGLAFMEAPPPSPPRSAPSTPTSSASSQWNQPVSLEDIISRALKLYQAYPLIGEGGIAADEVMGPKSCIFTWELSAEGLLSNEEAEDICREGIDIVVPEALEETKEAVVEEATPVIKRKRRSRRTLKKLELGIGTALVVVGVGVALASIYGGGDSKTLRERVVGRWPW